MFFFYTNTSPIVKKSYSTNITFISIIKSACKRQDRQQHSTIAQKTTKHSSKKHTTRLMYFNKNKTITKQKISYAQPKEKKKKNAKKTEHRRNTIYSKRHHFKEITHKFKDKYSMAFATLSEKEKQKYNDYHQSDLSTGIYTYKRKKNENKNSFRYSAINVSLKSHNGIFLWISKHKFYPIESLYRQETGKIGISFLINSSGFITKIDIDKPSQYTTLNMAALKIVHNSSPIPKNLLHSIKYFPVKAKINIVFNIE